jgi:two-component system NtrC family sensor kinase
MSAGPDYVQNGTNTHGRQPSPAAQNGPLSPAEKASVQKKLADLEKLATIGKLASKVAHELNNPLDGILRYINLAIRIVEQENLEKPTEYLIQARQGLMRMVQIVSELLEFSRTAHASFEYASLEHMVDDALKTMAGRIEAAGIDVVTDFASPIPHITGGNLFQVFCNLTKNAVDAMPSGGTLTVSAQVAEDGKNVEVSFRDTGNGIAEDNIERLFEAFFTTKGKGVGLGLAICREIVNRYQGSIIAANAPGGGSVFTVRLPASAG